MFKISSKLLRYLIVTLFVSYATNGQSIENGSLSLNQQSEQFLRDIKAEKNTSEFRAQLANTSVEILEKSLLTDTQKLAFWVNVYNGYIQIVLSENPESYNDRGAFFKKKQIPIAGDILSFEKIEHGIIRKSQWPLGLGYIRKWFPNKLERKLRVENRDYRVHFALNCGAKDCPPVAIYEVDKLDAQFSKGTEIFLKGTSTYEKDSKKLIVTPLFSWFRGDFGGKKGVKNILKEFKIIPTTKNIDIAYKNYDWTLDLDNWTDL
ncbi:MAG: DUF547 domain-containing protein [Cellulophaga sp.]|nr:DUF547 domain-containing protein [Cellulophaga sp.]